MKIRNLVQLIIFILSIQFLNSGKCFSQETFNEFDSIYKDISVALTPKRPYATEDLSIQLYLQMYNLLTENKYDFRYYNYVYENDSIVIKLKSGISWELLGFKQEPKAPIFFLIRLIINKENPKVNRRFEYLVFNSVCEQKPELAYKLIDNVTLYQNEEDKNNLVEKKLVCTMAYDSLGNLYIVK